ncbi:MAG: hypothetical protein ACE5NG_08735 [bacterium]
MLNRKPQFNCMTRGGVAILFTYLVVTNLLLLSVLLAVWPSFKFIQLSSELRIFLITIAGAGVGSTAFALISLVELFIKRRLFSRHRLWYLILPFTGMTTGLLVYVVLRAGILKLGSQTEVLNPYTIFLLSALAGFWSRHILGRLKRYAFKRF